LKDGQNNEVLIARQFINAITGAFIRLCKEEACANEPPNEQAWFGAGDGI
jgi:hypothetical protein